MTEQRTVTDHVSDCRCRDCTRRMNGIEPLTSENHNMLPMLEDYDWKEAFYYAKGFTREDVAEVIDHRLGENDGANWIMYGRLKDGRYFALEAGCDYTGWDCQAGGTSIVKDTLPELLRDGLGDDERDRYGIKL